MQQQNWQSSSAVSLRKTLAELERKERESNECEASKKAGWQAWSKPPGVVAYNHDKMGRAYSRPGREPRPTAARVRVAAAIYRLKGNGVRVSKKLFLIV